MTNKLHVSIATSLLRSFPRPREDPEAAAGATVIGSKSGHY